jgi:nucleoside 2-deoxyribosyltransferase
MSDKILDDPDFKTFAQQIRENMLPAMKGSAYVISIAPPSDADVDVKLAVEIGYAILLDKPLIVFKIPGRVIGEKLMRIADHVVEGDLETDEGQAAAMAQITRIMRQ